MINLGISNQPLEIVLMKLSVGFFLPKGMYPSLSIGGHLKINTWHSFRSIELVKASRENFLAFVDHIGQFFAFQAVCLLFAKEFSKQSIIFEISKLYWCKRSPKTNLSQVFVTVVFSDTVF